MTHKLTIHRQHQKNYAIRLRLLIITILFVVSSTVGDLLLFVTPSYAEPAVKDIPYTIAGRINGCGTMQGGTADGQYLYFVCVSDDHNKMKIVKVTPSGQIVDTSKTYTRNQLGHANGITYNEKLKLLVVGSWDYGGNDIQFIDPTTWDIKESKKAKTSDGQATSNICYNASTDQYVVSGKLYNADFKYQNKKLYTPAGVDEDLGTTEGKILNQGIACDSSYIYVMRIVWGQHGYNMIAVYDWSGNNVALYKISLNDEGENMSVINGSFYMGVNEGGMSTGGNHKNDYFIKLNGITTSATTASSTPSFKVATYNIRATELDSWSKDSRGSAILDYLKTVDVAGVQEVRNDSRAALKKGLSAAGYTKSEANVAVDIFWKTNMFTATDQGSAVVLDHVKCGGDSDVLKALVWVKLKEKTSGIEFYFLTTHLDVNTNECRVKQINNVLNIVQSKMADAPAIFVGDMNANSGEEPVNAITSSGFSDAYETATQKINIDSSSTLSGIGGQRRNGSPIDHIYTKGGVTVSRIEIKDQAGSDHLPVEASLLILGENQGNCHDKNEEQFSDWNINLYDPSCVSTCTEPTSTDAISGDTNAEKAFNFFISNPVKTNDGQPLNAAQAAGIVGNLMRESGGDGYELDPTIANSSGHTGIAQWDKTDRFAKLKTFASDNGLVWKDLETQLKYIYYELEGRYAQSVMKPLSKVTDISEQGARDAAKIFADHYEVSGGDATPRENNAVKAFNDFKDNAAGTPTADSSSGCAEPTASDGSVKALQEKAKAFTQARGQTDTTADGAKQTAAYTAAAQKSKYDGDCSGNDCGGFVYILMHESGWDADYGDNSGQTDHMATWFSDSSHGWESVMGSVGGNDVIKAATTGDLQPGDVMLTNGHIFAFVGDMFGDGKQYFVSASQCKRSPTYDTGAAVDTGKQYTIWRKNNLDSE